MKSVWIFTLATMLFAPACTKEGPTGPQGATGNANVRSTTFTVNPGDWYAFGTSGQVGYGFAAEEQVSIITGEIANTGSVLLYVSTGSGWAALPFTVPLGSWSSSFTYQYQAGAVRIEMYDSDLLTVPPGNTQTYKVLAIASSGMPVVPIDLHDYEAVADYYDIE